MEFSFKSRTVTHSVSAELLIRIHFQRRGEETMASFVAVGWSVLHIEHKELIRPHDSAVSPFITVSCEGIHYLPSMTPSMTEWETEAKMRVRGKQLDWFRPKSLLSWLVLWLHVSGLQLWDNVKHMVPAICFLIQDATTVKQHSLKLQCSLLLGNVEVSFQHMSNICEKLKNKSVPIYITGHSQRAHIWHSFFAIC